MNLRSIALVSLLALGATLGGCARIDHQHAASSVAPAANKYEPARDWRAMPLSVAASYKSEDLEPLLERRTAIWQPMGPDAPMESSTETDPWIAVQVPPARQKSILWTYSVPNRKSPKHVTLETSKDSSNGKDGTWQTIAEDDPRYLMTKMEIPADGSNWARLRFSPLPAKRDAPKPPGLPEFSIADIGLYEITPGARHDYWLFIGASLEEQSIRDAVFSDMVAARWPGRDPALFNEAVSGWRTEQLVRDLPKFLAKHPHASYVCIGIGGNNISASRPYPGGADKLRTDLVVILDAIKASGKTPILPRLSYRAYKASETKGAVPPEENGSGPYVTAIFDPLIAQYCPDFVDPTTGLCRVDSYTYFKNHPEELSTDGIHLNKVGCESWNRLWVEGAGPVIYGGK